MFGCNMGYESDASLKLVNPLNNRLAAITRTLLARHCHQPLCEPCSTFWTVEAAVVGARIAVVSAAFGTRVVYASDYLSAIPRTGRFCTVFLHQTSPQRAKTSTGIHTLLTVIREEKDKTQGEHDERNT